MSDVVDHLSIAPAVGKAAAAAAASAVNGILKLNGSQFSPVPQ